VPYQITPADRTSFRRCRRQWDFGAAGRRNLEPLGPHEAFDLGQALREALDIYYFPGMWDWAAEVTRPLVFQALDRALTRQRERCGGGPDDETWRQRGAAGRRLLESYTGWAPAVDQFAPVQVQAEYDVHILDPGGNGLVTARGDAVRYLGTIDLLAVDSHDAYWIMRHRVVAGDWLPADALVADEDAAAACWAWEQFYLGMAIVGTVYNEIRAGGPPSGRPAPLAGRRAGGLRRWLPGIQDKPPRRRVRQHEPSGGGRSIPQHRRLYATAREPGRFDRIEQHAAAEFRRTWVRRSREEVAEAGRRLAADAAQMAGPGVTTEPSPSPANCPPCPYLAPCRAMSAGQVDVSVLLSGYRERPALKLAEGRLGGGAWGMGRGAAPPKFRGES
jgi:hypothetical protein